MNQRNQLIEGFEHLRPQVGREYEPDGAIEYGGNWRISRDAGRFVGTAAQSNPRLGRVVFAATHYTNATATTRVRLDTRGHAGLIVRAGARRGTT